MRIHGCCIVLQEMCRQAKLEYAEETRKANELHDRLADERRQAKYNKHYDICMQVWTDQIYTLDQILPTTLFKNPELRNNTNGFARFMRLRILYHCFHCYMLVETTVATGKPDNKLL